jgi:hypothetical protein
LTVNSSQYVVALVVAGMFRICMFYSPSTSAARDHNRTQLTLKHRVENQLRTTLGCPMAVSLLVILTLARNVIPSGFGEVLPGPAHIINNVTVPEAHDAGRTP